MSADGHRRPAVLVFDVNETLSDMSPMVGRFEDVGAPAHLAKTCSGAVRRRPDGCEARRRPPLGHRRRVARWPRHCLGQRPGAPYPDYFEAPDLRPGSMTELDDQLR